MIPKFGMYMLIKLSYAIKAARTRRELFDVDMMRHVVQEYGVPLHMSQIRVRAPGTGQ